MNKKLELLFENEEGKQVTVALDNPVEPVDPELVLSSMQSIIDGNTLTSTGGNLVSVRGARVVEHSVEVIDLK